TFAQKRQPSSPSSTIAKPSHLSSSSHLSAGRRGSGVLNLLHLNRRLLHLIRGLISPRTSGCDTVLKSWTVATSRDRSNIGGRRYLPLHFYLLFCTICFTPMRFPRIKAEGQSFYHCVSR